MTTIRRAAAVLAAGFLVTGSAAAAGAQPADAQENHPEYWEQFLMDEGYVEVDCEKIDNYNEASYTADQDYLFVVLKAGSAQSTDGEERTWFYNVEAGEELMPSTGKDISHVIVCVGEMPEAPPTEEPPTKEPEHPGKPEQPGKPIGPVVQTDVPEKGVNAALPLAALTAAGLGLAAVGLRRRGQES